MSRASKSPIPPKMYKHFAIVTIAFTALLALFAEGEKDKEQELVQQAARELQRQETEARNGLRSTLAAAPIDGNAMERFDAVRGEGSFGDDVAFGQPTETAPMSGGKVAHSPVGYTPLSEEYLATLSEEEREALLKGLEEAGMLDPKRRQELIAALDRASAARSGARPGAV